VAIEEQRRYEAFLEEIQRKKGTEYNWEEADELINRGKVVISGPWKMKVDESTETEPRKNVEVQNSSMRGLNNHSRILLSYLFTCYTSHIYDLFLPKYRLAQGL